jgi:tape measure domain-containing protein
MTTRIARAIEIGISSNTTEARRDLAKVEAALRAVKDPTVALQKSVALLNDIVKQEGLSQQQAALAMMHLGRQAEKQIQKNKELAKSYASNAAAIEAERIATERLTRHQANQRNGLREQDRIERDRALAQEQRQAREERLAERRRQDAADLRTASSMGPGDSLIDAERRRRERLEADRLEAERNARVEANRRRGLQEQDRIERDRALAQEQRQAREERLAERRRLLNRQLEDGITQREGLRESGRSYMVQFDTRQEATNRRLAEAADLHMRGALTANEYARAVRGIHRENSLLSSGVNQMRGVFATLIGPLTVTITAFEGIRRSIQLANEFDTAKAKFSTFLGSDADATQMMGKLRALTSQTPISFSSAQKTATTLLQYQVAEEQVIDVTKRLATVTAGNTEQMERLGLAYGQVMGAGRVMGQEVLQMINAGFNPLRIIAAKSGESMAQVKKRMEEGGVGAEELAEALRSVTDQGGQFYGLLDRISNEAPGKWTKLRSEIEKTGTAFGKFLQPGTNAIVDSLTNQLTVLRGSSSAQDPRTRFAEDLARMRATSALAKPGLIDNPMALWTSAASANKGFYSELAVGREVEELLNGADRNAGWSAKAISKFDEITKAERNLKKVDSAGMRTANTDLDKELSLSKSKEDKIRAWVKYEDRIGQGFFRDEDVEILKAYRTELERINVAKANSKRIEEAFQDALDREKKNRIKGLYGDRSGTVEALLEQSTGKERMRIQKLIEGGASFGDIRNAANPEARAKVDELDNLIKQTEKLDAAEKARKEKEKEAERTKDKEEAKAKKVKEQLKDLDAEVKYRKELITLGREQAEINKLMRQDDLSHADAKAIRDKQAILEKLNYIDRISPSGAPRAMQAGSQEAFAAMANNQAAMVGEQLRLQREQLRKQAMQLVATNRTNDLLENMETV